MIANPATATRATIDDLYSVDGKAELIGGRIVPLMGTGFRPSLIAATIYRSLFAYVLQLGRGWVFTDNMVFAVPKLISGRESFSPDASYYAGPAPANEMDFISGAPTFAVEVRSKGDYGPAAELEMARKRLDYFEAGTAIVWDVDPKAGLIRAYRADSPELPIVFGVGQQADAEPAIPRWSIAVDLIFA